MESALRLAKDGRFGVTIYWVLVQDAMREFFSDMFCPLPDYARCVERADYSGFVKHLFSWKNPMRYNPGEEERLIDRMFTKGPGLLTAYYNCEEFYAPVVGGEYDYSWLKPLPVLEKKIDAEMARLDGVSIGIHIRRTDNKWAIAHSQDELFFRALDREVDADESVKFYLASDDEETKLKFGRRYGSRIEYRQVLVRHSAGSIADAVVDLMVLSRMKKLYGSYRSSFSSVASKIQGIPLAVVSDLGKHI